jgi:hypothetical protein
MAPFLVINSSDRILNVNSFRFDLLFILFLFFLFGQVDSVITHTVYPISRNSKKMENGKCVTISGKR